MTGAWRVLAPSEPESKTARQRLSALNERVTPDRIVGTRKLPLDFYDNATLYESEILQENGQHGIITYVQRGTETVLLDGTSPPIHKMNEKSPPKLDTPERASAYLRFFVGAIQSDDGRFMLLDRLDDIRWRPRVPPKQRSDAAKKIGPLVVEMTPGGGWQAIGTIQYSNALFATRLALRRNGTVEMDEDKPLAVDLAVFVERFVNGIRIMQTLEEARLANTREKLKLNPNDAEALRQLPRLYYDLKRWKEAVEAQQKWVEFVHQQIEKDPKMRERLPGSYTSLAWYQLVARDFAGALASSEVGLKLDESNLPLETNRAHALLFLGRTQEAEAIYLEHRGKKIGANSDKKWEEAILEDFDALKKERITRPEMTRIQKLLKPESK